jgi:hypothetical protein
MPLKGEQTSWEAAPASSRPVGRRRTLKGVRFKVE